MSITTEALPPTILVPGSTNAVVTKARMSRTQWTIAVHENTNIKSDSALNLAFSARVATSLEVKELREQLSTSDNPDTQKPNEIAAYVVATFASPTTVPSDLKPISLPHVAIAPIAKASQSEDERHNEAARGTISSNTKYFTPLIMFSLIYQNAHLAKKLIRIWLTILHRWYTHDLLFNIILH